jgi:hypothetical protein
MGVEKIHACPNHCILFVVKRSKVWINVLGMGPVGTRTMTFTVMEKPPPGRRGIRRVPKRWYKNLNLQRTPH